MLIYKMTYYFYIICKYTDKLININISNYISKNLIHIGGIFTNDAKDLYCKLKNNIIYEKIKEKEHILNSDFGEMMHPLFKCDTIDEYMEIDNKIKKIYNCEINKTYNDKYKLENDTFYISYYDISIQLNIK